MALPVNGSSHLIPAYYSIYRPRKDERLSWPSWLTYSGWLTHISGHPSAAGRAQEGQVRRPETDVLPLCHATNRTDTYAKSQGQSSVGSDASVETNGLTDTTDRITFPANTFGNYG